MRYYFRKSLRRKYFKPWPLRKKIDNCNVCVYRAVLETAKRLQIFSNWYCMEIKSGMMRPITVPSVQPYRRPMLHRIGFVLGWQPIEPWFIYSVKTFMTSAISAAMLSFLIGPTSFLSAIFPQCTDNFQILLKCSTSSHQCLQLKFLIYRTKLTLNIKLPAVVLLSKISYKVNIHSKNTLIYWTIERYWCIPFYYKFWWGRTAHLTSKSKGP